MVMFCTSYREESMVFFNQVWNSSATLFSHCLPSSFRISAQILGSSIGLSPGGTSDRVDLAVAPELEDGFGAETSVVLGGALGLVHLDAGLGSNCLGKVLYSWSSRLLTREDTVEYGTSLNSPNCMCGEFQNQRTASLF